jgi:hypothetical protein
VGAVCGADLHRFIRGNCRWAKSVQSARNRCMALGLAVIVYLLMLGGHVQVIRVSPFPA